MDELLLVRARYGRPVQALMVAMLLGLSGFFGTMAVLVSHDSSLECQASSGCTHVERYPLGLGVRTPLAPIKKAEVQWDTGGRSRALKLVLRHADGTRTDFQGVGKNGERAEDTANELNAMLQSNPATDRTFLLREGSLPFALFLALLAIAALVLSPHFFSKVRLSRSPAGITVAIGRWPAKARRHLIPPGDLAQVGLKQSIANGEQFYTVQLERPSGPAIELGIAFRSAERALEEQELVARALSFSFPADLNRSA